CPSRPARQRRPPRRTERRRQVRAGRGRGGRGVARLLHGHHARAPAGWGGGRGSGRLGSAAGCGRLPRAARGRGAVGRAARARTRGGGATGGQRDARAARGGASPGLRSRHPVRSRPCPRGDHMRRGCRFRSRSFDYGVKEEAMPDRKLLPGKFVWFELVSRDAKEAQAFYGAVLGWKTLPFPMGDATYEMICAGDTPDTMIGGYAAPTSDRQPSHWISYLSVEDVDATAKAATASGGRVIEA